MPGKKNGAVRGADTPRPARSHQPDGPGWCFLLELEGLSAPIDRSNLPAAGGRDKAFKSLTHQTKLMQKPWTKRGGHPFKTDQNTRFYRVQDAPLTGTEFHWSPRAGELNWPGKDAIFRHGENSRVQKSRFDREAEDGRKVIAIRRH